MNSTGYIDGNGVYHKKVPKPATMVSADQVTYKHWSHDRQREEHRGDLVQPYNRDGTPNQQFIELYPEESNEYGMTPGENNGQD